jgi:hypothetical protein
VHHPSAASQSTRYEFCAKGYICFYDASDDALTKIFYGSDHFEALGILRRSRKVIDWGRFFDSMAEAGFAEKNGGGSIITFEHTTGGGKIIFQLPHAEPTIDPIMLQAMRKRLNKWFGWNRETFAPVEK